MAYRIDRCFCFGRTFQELKGVAETKKLTTIPELQDELHFGTKCMLCHPYVRRMLRTGQVVFTEIITDEDEPPPVNDLVI